MLSRIVAKWDAVVDPHRRAWLADLGTLALRVGFGLMMAFSHGLGKLQGWADYSGKFPDPLGVSSPVSLAMTIGAEFFCSLLLVVGLATRVAVIPLLVAMGVAFFVIHGDDPFPKREPALTYLTVYVALLFLGAGRFSLDHWIAGRARR